MTRSKGCTHLGEIGAVTPSGDGCKECMEIGETWVHLRLCMTCGHVGCCDDSKNKHATEHSHTIGHPIIKSFEPGEQWGWCYVDEAVLDPVNWSVHGPTAHSVSPEYWSWTSQ